MFLPAPVVFVLAVLGGILEVVQEAAITMSAQAHSIAAFAIIVVLAFGVVPLGASALRRLIPSAVAAALTAASGILAAVQQTFGVTGVVHGLILFVLAILAAVGIVPTVTTLAAGRSLLAQKSGVKP